MPMANCFFSPQLKLPEKKPTGVIEYWGMHTGIDTSQMTIQFNRMERQYGNPYKVFATLILPSIWSSEEISLLQIGLSRALSDYLNIESKEIMVTTSIIESGLVVENDRELHW